LRARTQYTPLAGAAFASVASSKAIIITLLSGTTTADRRRGDWKLRVAAEVEVACET
jgi:hypothetical protein